MAASWEEVEQAEKENRHELILTGPDVSKRIENKGLDNYIFSLKSLNFLEISKTCLTLLPPELCNLVNLTNLVVEWNKLTSIPPEIGQLSKLKYLDLSRNKLESVPDDVAKLTELQHFNISGNSLVGFPDVSSMVQLHSFDLSQNQLTSLPAGITSPNLLHLAQLLASGNQIEELPGDLSELPSLKTFDVSDNCLLAIPPDVSECVKLKEFRYGGNKLKDRRLGRMMEQCSTKAVLDYLRVILEKERKASGGGKSKDKKKKKKGKSEKEEIDELAKNLLKVLHFSDENGLNIAVNDNVLPVRQYLVCCVVKNLDFNKSKNMFKRFLALQTKLHDTTCRKRQFATIATHDMKAVNLPLTYEARVPSQMILHPLGKMKETTANKLVAKLWKEADDFRKEKKRNTLSGIHQYLDLLEGKPRYPCMVDSKGTIISFPPITNCDLTKVSRETVDILVEVTSTVNLEACKTVMDELLRGLLEMGIGCHEPPAPPGATGGEDGPVAGLGADTGGLLLNDQVLVLEQVRVLDHSGGLKVVYPSRVDLQNEAFRVERETDT